jgi:hypothetical protein
MSTRGVRRSRAGQIMGRIAWLAAASIVAVAAVAAPAAADSMVYVKDGNVWLANADGSSPYQVTLDGTAANPYESSSEADDGTIVAIRQVPGERRRIYRMTQSGGLLNPPIDTPAPGTGAIDARVSPDGRYVAYWFVTTVNDPLCSFCVDVTNRALISRSDSFTNADEIGTPNTGGWPSWDGNTTLVLTNGSGTVWYYTIGMPEAAIWFDNSVFGDGQFPTLLDGEVSHDGTRFALVRGDNQETLITFAMTGAIPAAPTPQCAFTGPTGKFVNPTWSTDGLTLAWKEDTGIWEDTIPNVGDCTSYGMPHLVIPGGTDPDFSPAPVNPGARPACGNPGNPTACSGTSTTTTTLPGANTTTTTTIPTTTVPPPPCAGLTGLPRVQCQLSDALAQPLCGSEVIPPAIDGALRTKLQAANTALGSVATARAQKGKKLRKRAVADLRAASTHAAHAAKAKKAKRHVSASCAATIASLTQQLTQELSSP